MTIPSELSFLETNGPPSKAGRLLQPYRIVTAIYTKGKNAVFAKIYGKPIEEATLETFDLDGNQLIVIFQGPNAEERAKEYIDFQNQRNEE